MMRPESIMMRSADSECPRVTRNPRLNERHLQQAQEEQNYGEPDQADGDQRCGNCAAFDQRDSVLECIATGLEDRAEDAGYCQALDFVCSAQRVCDAWLEGGPITSEEAEDEDESEEDADFGVMIAVAEPVEPADSLERLGISGARSRRR